MSIDYLILENNKLEASGFNLILDSLLLQETLHTISYTGNQLDQ